MTYRELVQTIATKMSEEQKDMEVVVLLDSREGEYFPIKRMAVNVVDDGCAIEWKTKPLLVPGHPLIIVKDN